MRWSRVCLEAIAYELPQERVTSAQLEARLEPIYAALRLGEGQLEALTGIRERRMWPPGPSVGALAARAGKKALEAAGVDASELGALHFGGVCKDTLEPATACIAAEALGVAGDVVISDVGNACLGVLSGMVQVANAIELRQIRAGLVVSAESSREIVDATIARMNAEPTLERLKLCLATLTGGSAAVGVVLTDASISRTRRHLLGGAALAAPEHHRLCRWGPSRGLLGETTNVTDTDASAVLANGVPLGAATFEKFLRTLEWRPSDLDKVICHQVGGGHRKAILDRLAIDEARDFSTFDTLGNTGTCALPMTAAIAEERGFLSPGDRVGFLGIGSGLNCLMLGVQW